MAQPTPITIPTLEQFTRFSTDAYGLERILRLLQSLAQLLLSYPTLHLFLPSSLLPFLSSPDLLPHLRSRLATIRRPLRLFRFLDVFRAAWETWNDEDDENDEGEMVRWCDVGAKSFTGMYLLLESITFVEALDVQGLGVWGEERAGVLAVEAQRMWFFGLGCAVLGGVVRLAMAGGKGKVGGEKVEGKEGEKKKESEKEGEKQKQQDATRAEERQRTRKIVRKMVADVMDLSIPGSIVGWVPFDAGTVSLLMFWSTILTSMEIWERCGRELVAEKAAKVAKASKKR